MRAENPSKPKRTKATPEIIVAAARTIALRAGWTAVTIRAVADDLGYTSPIIYEHFKNKDGLIAAAARVGFDDLEEALSSVDGEIGSEERLAALGVEYVAFALRHPELYRVMHGMDGAVTDPAEIAAGAQRVCEIAMRELRAWAEATKTSLPDPYGATEILWCLVHGIATLELAQRLGSVEKSRVAEAVRTMLNGWRFR